MGSRFTGRHENPHIAWPTAVTRSKQVGGLVQSVTTREPGCGNAHRRPPPRAQAMPLAAEEEDPEAILDLLFVMLCKRYHLRPIPFNVRDGSFATGTEASGPPCS